MIGAAALEPTTISSTTAPPARCSTTRTATAPAPRCSSRRSPTGLAPDRGRFHRLRRGQHAARDHLRRDRQRRREQPGEHDRLPGRRDRRRRRPDHLFADRRRRLAAHHRRRHRRGPAERPGRFRDQEPPIIVQRRRQQFRQPRPRRRWRSTITDVSEAAARRRSSTRPAAPNNSRNNAQAIDRDGFAVATNPNLPNDDLPSATIVGSISGQCRHGLLLDHAAGRRAADPRRRRHQRRSIRTCPHLRQPDGTEIGDNDDLVVDDPGSRPAASATIPIPRSASARRPAAPIISRSNAFQERSSTPTVRHLQLHVSIGPPATRRADRAGGCRRADQRRSNGRRPTSPTPSRTRPDEYPSAVRRPGRSEPASFAPFTAIQQSAVPAMLQQISTLTPADLTSCSATMRATRSCAMR